MAEVVEAMAIFDVDKSGTLEVPSTLFPPCPPLSDSLNCYRTVLGVCLHVLHGDKFQI